MNLHDSNIKKNMRVRRLVNNLCKKYFPSQLLNLIQKGKDNLRLMNLHDSNIKKYEGSKIG